MPYRFRSRWLCVVALLAFLTGCQPGATEIASPSPAMTPPTPSAIPPTVTPLPVPTSSRVPTATITPTPLVPRFAHILVIVLENREFGSVIGRSTFANANRLAEENTLLTQYYAIMHPSLPNYIAMLGGDTFGIESNCTDCFVNAPSLPDQIEDAGRTWRGYFEDIPRPCYVGDTVVYVQKHNPFIYFDPIRTDKIRCERSVVSLEQLEDDLNAGTLPDFAYIVPNQCNNGHECVSSVSDTWLGNWVPKLQSYLEPRAAEEPYLIFITWEEGQGNHSCCGLPVEAGGRVPAILISPLVKNGFQDETPYTHYSLLKTIEEAWGLPYLGHAADENNVLIVAPWK